MSVCVNDADHTALTVVALGAVEPDWVSILDFDSERGHSWPEAREEPSGSISRRRLLNWYAWVGKSSTNNGVIPWEELELYLITNGSLNIIWIEDQTPFTTDHSPDGDRGLSRNESGKGGKNDDSLGEHCDFFWGKARGLLWLYRKTVGI